MSQLTLFLPILITKVWQGEKCIKLLTSSSLQQDKNVALLALEHLFKMDKS